MTKAEQFDVIVVGAGFAGMYALYKLRSLGYSVKVFEAGDGVGGTWYWNRYPGARCDVDSLEYSYQFSEELQQEWHWSEKYAPQPEILEYANHVADRFELRCDIQFNTRIASMHFIEQDHSWRVSDADGNAYSSRFCIMATGCLSKNNIPDIPGLDTFQGELIHTGAWPHQGVDFENKSVGIIGTGSSAIQATPLIAAQAKSLSVFQRTASFSIPARNAPMNEDYEKSIKADYPNFRAANSQRYAALNNNPNTVSALAVSTEELQATYEQRWQHGGLPFLAAFNDLGSNLDANRTAVEFIHGKIRGIVDDPTVAELLCPDTVMGCKRLCVDTDYYRSFNRDNVHLVDLNAEAIVAINEQGIETPKQQYDLDILILATGFDAMTGALLSIDIRGRDQLSLQEKWQEGPSNYLGLTVNGFPNFFTITGPGSPSVLANMIVAIEQHVDWIADCLTHLKANSINCIEASVEAETNWVKRVNMVAEPTLYPTSCNSWYTGANIPGKPRIFMPYLGYPSYVEQCDRVAATGYQGFELS